MVIFFIVHLTEHSYRIVVTRVLRPFLTTHADNAKTLFLYSTHQNTKLSAKLSASFNKANTTQYINQGVKFSFLLVLMALYEA